MARSKFGGTNADIVVQLLGPFVGLARPQQLTAWSAKVGGTRYMDLLDAAGQPTTAIVMTSSGQVPLFWGPDGITELWIDDGDAERALMVTQGRQGEPGDAGQSAYGAWLDAGNVGTEADFLDSLRSQVPGPPGQGGWMVDPLDPDVLVVTPGDQVEVDPDDSDVLVVTA